MAAQPSGDFESRQEQQSTVPTSIQHRGKHCFSVICSYSFYSRSFT